MTETENRIYPKARQARHGHTTAREWVSLTIRISTRLEAAIMCEAGKGGDKSKVVRRVLMEYFEMEE